LTWNDPTLKHTDIHAVGGIGTHTLSRRADADLRLRPCDYWDRQNNLLTSALHNHCSEILRNILVCEKTNWNEIIDDWINRQALQ
jgi:hypothetical protein